MSYQTFSHKKGVSDSLLKLRKIRMPVDLTGLDVLDIGCNAGFFSIEAKNRNANYVLGIDTFEKFINEALINAKLFNKDIDFRVKNILDLDYSKQFDLILLTSILHYFDNPVYLFDKIKKLLKPNGILILECGVVKDDRSSIYYTIRSIDEQFFPSEELLIKHWLKDFKVDYISQSVNQVGDPIDRHVYHCQYFEDNNKEFIPIIDKKILFKSVKDDHMRILNTAKRRCISNKIIVKDSSIKPTVLLIKGNSKNGKTHLTLELTESFDNVVNFQTDNFFILDEFQHIKDIIARYFEGSDCIPDENIGEFVDSYSNEWLECKPLLINEINRFIDNNKDKDLIIIEGYMLYEIADEIKSNLVFEMVNTNIKIGNIIIDNNENKLEILKKILFNGG